MSRDPMEPGEHPTHTVTYHPAKKVAAEVLSLNTGVRLKGGTSNHTRPETGETEPHLGEWDAGDDVDIPPPRGWLLGNIFCRGFMSSLLADGGGGKTALRYAQLLSLAIGRSLTGDHVFQRCRVLIVSLEDDRDE